MKLLRSPSAVFALICLASAPAPARGQSAKQIEQDALFWTSFQTVARTTDRLGAVAEFQLRRRDFVEDPDFYLLRLGARYWLRERLNSTLGYVHEWLAPEPGNTTWVGEDRFYQELEYESVFGRKVLKHRFRNELRWRDVVAGDELTGDHTFTDRVRYEAAFTLPLAESPGKPALLFSNEILIQFGSGVVANTFDQERLFAGIKHRMSHDLSFDLGYMLIFHEHANGIDYDLNHALRWFFYFTPDLRRPGGHEP